LNAIESIVEGGMTAIRAGQRTRGVS
jgi:hypothetical protein